MKRFLDKKANALYVEYTRTDGNETFHHKDGNKTNDKFSNCQAVHTRCHRKKHAEKMINKQWGLLYNWIGGKGLIAIFLALGGAICFGSTGTAFADPQHCYWYGECYNIGYGNEYVDGQNGYSPINACYYHTEAYCEGYYQGYMDGASNNTNNGLQQGQSSQVNIHGNNNDVNINQAQDAQSGIDGGGSESWDSYHGTNPRCLLICATVNH